MPPAPDISAHAVLASNLASKVIPIEASSAPDPNSGIQTGRWSNGFCDCCNVIVPNCLMSCCCPCVALAQVYARIGIISYRTALCHGALAPLAIIIVCLVQPEPATTTTIIVVLAVGIVFSLLVCYDRTRVRHHFTIAGDCCKDCCVSVWCSCCAIAQMTTHTRSYRRGDCSLSGPEMLPAYPSESSQDARDFCSCFVGWIPFCDY
jgi:Cys-rich protein (TIGR01571 family)